MENPGLPESLWNQLNGGLWHATDKAGLYGIARSGEISVSTASRYKNSFCRQLGAVSFFDFGASTLVLIVGEGRSGLRINPKILEKNNEGLEVLTHLGDNLGSWCVL